MKNKLSIAITFEHAGMAAVLSPHDPFEASIGKVYMPNPAYLEFNPVAQELALHALYDEDFEYDPPLAVDNGTLIRFAITPYASRKGLEKLGENWPLAAMLSAVRDHYSESLVGNKVIGTVALPDGWKNVIIEHIECELLDEEVVSVEEVVLNEFNLVESLIVHGSIQAYAAHLRESLDDYFIGSMENAVATSVMGKVTDHFNLSEAPAPSIYIERAVELLNDFDGDRFGHLLDEYISRFGPRSVSQ